MNDYIIEPMWVYWISVIGALKSVCTAIAVCSAAAFVVALIELLCNLEWTEDTEYCAAKTALIITAPLLLIFTAAAIFIPSTKVLIEMEVAKIATKEHLTMTAEALKSVVDYVADTIRSLK